MYHLCGHLLDIPVIPDEALLLDCIHMSSEGVLRQWEGIVYCNGGGRTGVSQIIANLLSLVHGVYGSVGKRDDGYR